ncbi:hypothetical protein nbrc107696_32780 [Gordonia spumicola]|uniref:Uncharacterized protein n=1 Tax=Gordonia spumicola TaxID=589161 RepID=A0A7I9VCB6_9ACTN|nr:hypothetical protein [Gordonia spumicola]GEE02832.1 hypothetical protein nbrc107696_32780 [Gordonia spumicola]
MAISITDDLTKKAIPLEDVEASVEVFTLFGKEYVFFFADKDAAKKALEEGKFSPTEGTPVDTVKALLNAVLPAEATPSENDSSWLLNRYKRETLQEAARSAGITSVEVAKIATTPRLKNDTAKKVRDYVTENKIPADK